MNIMFLIDSLEGGGAERACLNVASSLCNEHRIWVVSVFKNADHVPGYYFDKRLNIIRLDIENTKKLTSKPGMYFREISSIRKLKKSLKIDLSISFLETANVLNVLTSCGEKKIISVRNYYSLSLRRERFFFRKIKAIASDTLADTIVTVSEDCRQDLIANFAADPRKTKTIYNFYEPRQEELASNVDTSRFYDRDNALKIVSMSRFHPQKAQQHLIRAFKEVSVRHPEVKLYIFGKGEEEGYLREVIKKNDLESAVFLMPFDPASSCYLKKADIYVCTSLYEGFSNSVLEAVNCGVPVISTDCHSGPRELLAPETDCSYKTDTIEYAQYGILIPPFTGDKLTDEPLEKSEQLLAEALEVLIDDPKLRKSYAHKEKERSSDFSRDKTIIRWQNTIYSTAKS